MKYLALIFFFPFLLVGDVNEEYSELFSQHLAEENFEKCEEILDNWASYHDPGSGQITALRASLLLCKSEIESGKNLLEQALNGISETYLSDSMKSIIKKMIERSPSFSLTAEDASYPHIMLCKRKQPKGLSFRYWFGVAQVVVGCIVVPFNPAAGGGLIATGVSTVVHAASDCIDNMEKWEAEAQERQRMGVENSAYFPAGTLNHPIGIISA